MAVVHDWLVPMANFSLGKYRNCEAKAEILPIHYVECTVNGKHFSILQQFFVQAQKFIFVTAGKSAPKKSENS
jgi:hypothetical protein